MDIRIGVTWSAKEIEVELADDADGDAVRKDVEAALSSPEGMLWMTDRRGRIVGIPAQKVAYIEINPREDRRVGFAAT